MGLFSSSKSSSNTTTNIQDQRKTLTDEAILAEAGATVLVERADANALLGLAAGVSNAYTSAASLGKDGLAASVLLGQGAYDLSRDVTNRAFDSADTLYLAGVAQNTAYLHYLDNAREAELAQQDKTLSTVSDVMIQAKQGDALTLAETVKWGMAAAVAALGLFAFLNRKKS